MSEYASGQNNNEAHERVKAHMEALDMYNTPLLKEYVDHLTSYKEDIEREIRAAQSLIDHREAAPQEFLWEDKPWAAN